MNYEEIGSDKIIRKVSRYRKFMKRLGIHNKISEFVLYFDFSLILLTIIFFIIFII